MNELELVKQFAQIITFCFAAISVIGIFAIIVIIMATDNDKRPDEYGGWK